VKEIEPDELLILYCLAPFREDYEGHERLLGSDVSRVWAYFSRSAGAQSPQRFSWPRRKLGAALRPSCGAPVLIFLL